MNGKEKIIEYLKGLNLSEIEAKLYLTLLETGPITVRELASMVDIKRTTTYFYIDRLVEKGLIIKIVKGAQKQVAANQPDDSLTYLVEKNIQTANIIKKEFPSVLKEINAAIPQFKEIGDAEIKYYKGKNGVKKIYEEALRSKELRSYVNLSEIGSVFPGNVDLFIDAFKHNPDLRMFEIMEDSSGSNAQIDKYIKIDRYSFKFLPEDVKLASTDILIYDGKVGIINVRNKISGVILKNVDYFNLSKELFDFIWKILPKTDTTHR